MENNFEVVEMCPHCEHENVYPDWDVSVKGYIAKCTHCGKEIFLCDECLHADDNEGMCCDWCETKCGGKCFRGETNDAAEHFITVARVVECSDYDVTYGVLTIENVTEKEVQEKIYEIKNGFLDEGVDDWIVDDVLAKFPDGWKWSFERNVGLLEI